MRMVETICPCCGKIIKFLAAEYLRLYKKSRLKDKDNFYPQCNICKQSRFYYKHNKIYHIDKIKKFDSCYAIKYEGRSSYCLNGCKKYDDCLSICVDLNWNGWKRLTDKQAHLIINNLSISNLLNCGNLHYNKQ